MLNFIKNNKYKIIILPAVLLVGIFIGSFGINKVFGDVQNIPQSDSKIHYEFAKDPARASDGPSEDTIDTYVLTDDKTKRQYLVIKTEKGVTVTPRLDMNGEHALVEQDFQ